QLGAAHGQVRAHLVGVVERDELLLLRDPDETVGAVDMAVRQQADALAVVMYDGHSLLHRDLQVPALLGLPIDDERRAFGLDAAADTGAAAAARACKCRIARAHGLGGAAGSGSDGRARQDEGLKASHRISSWRSE